LTDFFKIDVFEKILCSILREYHLDRMLHSAKFEAIAIVGQTASGKAEIAVKISRILREVCKGGTFHFSSFLEI
jgi:hypothetical protein